MCAYCHLLSLTHPFMLIVTVTTVSVCSTNEKYIFILLLFQILLQHNYGVVRIVLFYAFSMPSAGLVQTARMLHRVCRNNA